MGKNRFFKQFLLILLFSYVLIMTGCGKGGQGKPSDTPETSPTEATAPTEAPATPTPAATDTPTPSPTETPTPTPEIVVEDMEETTYVSTDSLNVRQGPGTKYDKIGMVQKGDRLIATGYTDNGWYRVKYEDGEGFVAGAYVVTESQFEVQNPTPTPTPTPTPNPKDSLDQPIADYAGFTGGAFAIIDVETGELLYSMNADTQLYPASLTKMMTGLLACERLPFSKIIPFPEVAGRWQYETSFIEAGPVIEVIPEGATEKETEEARQVYGLDNEMVTLSDAHSRFNDGSYVVPFGTEFSVEEMVNVLMLLSAADMADALAWTMGDGSLLAFNDIMNERAKELGMNNTYFDNAVGADDLGENQEFKHQNLYYMEQGNITTTAADLALLARAVLKNNKMREIVCKPSYELAGRADLPTITIPNGVLPVSNPATYSSKYFTSIGIKTGFTDWAGQNIALAGRDASGKELVCVYLKNQDTKGARANAAKQAIRLLEYAFRKMN